MLLHGIDLSLNSAGLCTIDLPTGKVSTKAITSGHAPLLPYSQRYDMVVRDLLREIAPSDVVFIEDYSYGSMQALTLLAELGGIVRYCLWKRTGYWPFAVGVGSVKKFATGKGGGKKEDVKLGVYKKWKLEFGTNDECDAFVISQLGLALLGLSPIPSRNGGGWCGYEIDAAEAVRRGGLKKRSQELQALAEKMA